MGVLRNFKIPVRIFSLNYSWNKGSSYKIVMARHGESEWNERNLFCGWYDAKLSEKGENEARQAGKILLKDNYKFDMAYTSVLQRANRTLELILEESRQKDIQICKNWRLNERHYGALTGLNKIETARLFGEDQVKIWRRSFSIPPPPMEPNHPYFKQIRFDPRYAKDGPNEQQFPDTESLQLTARRTLPYWFNVISPQIKLGKKIIIVAHGNSLRAIVKYLFRMDEAKIMALNLPTGIPFEVTLNDKLLPIGEMKFLGDAEAVKKAMEQVANQGKIK